MAGSRTIASLLLTAALSYFSALLPQEEVIKPTLFSRSLRRCEHQGKWAYR